MFPLIGISRLLLVLIRLLLITTFSVLLVIFVPVLFVLRFIIFLGPLLLLLLLNSVQLGASISNTPVMEGPAAEDLA